MSNDVYINHRLVIIKKYSTTCKIKKSNTIFFRCSFATLVDKRTLSYLQDACPNKSPEIFDAF